MSKSDFRSFIAVFLVIITMMHFHISMIWLLPAVAVVVVLYVGLFLAMYITAILEDRKDRRDRKIEAAMASFDFEAMEKRSKENQAKYPRIFKM